MKTTFLLLLIQLANIITGFFSIYFIASSVSPDIYSIIGVHTIVCAFVIAFSFVGQESVLSRNLLYWQRIKCNNKIDYIISNTLYSRVFLSIIIIILMIIYVSLYSHYKLKSRYLIELILLTFSSIFYSLNTSFTLIQRGFNRFISAAICSLITGTFIKILALVALSHYGFNYFIYITALSPVIVTVYFFISIKKHLSIKYLRLNIRNEIKKNKNFILSNYLNFSKNFLDQILCSIFLSAEYFATYNIMKKIEDTLRLVIENIFDPLSQKLIKFKNTSSLGIEAYKIKKIRNILTIIALISIISIIPYIEDLILLVNLNNYPYLYFSIVIVLISQLIYLISKPDINIISLLYNPLTILKFNFYPIVFSLIFSLLIIFTMPSEFLFINRLIVYLTSLITALYYVKKQDNCSYV